MIVVFGSINVDLIVAVDRLPTAGQTLLARDELRTLPGGKGATQAAAAVDVLIVNEDEAAWLGRHLGCGGEAAALHRALGAAVIRTLGGDGAEWVEAGRPGRAPTPRVTVRDTTGAGDCFVRVLAAALDRGAGLEAAIRRAVTAASLSCTRPGAQASMPTAHETDAATA
jgi:ribokinase